MPLNLPTMSSRLVVPLDQWIYNQTKADTKSGLLKPGESQSIIDAWHKLSAETEGSWADYYNEGKTKTQEQINDALKQRESAISSLFTGPVKDFFARHGVTRNNWNSFYAAQRGGKLPDWTTNILAPQYRGQYSDPLVNLPVPTPTQTVTQNPTLGFNNPTDFWNWANRNTPLKPSDLPGIPGPSSTTPTTPTTPAIPNYNAPSGSPTPTPIVGNRPQSTIPTTPATSGPQALAQRTTAPRVSPFQLPSYYNVPTLPSLDFTGNKRKQRPFGAFPTYNP